MLTRTVRRSIIALSIVVLLVLVYAALGFWALPRFLRSGASDFVRSHYQRQLKIGDIRFNPFTFTLDIADFSLPDSDGQPMLAFNRLHVDLEISSLFRLGPSFREIVLEAPRVRTVVRHDGSLNLADLGKGFVSTPPPKTPPKPSEPMRLFIDRFAVVAGSGTFEDLSHATPFHAELKPIAFELRNFSTRAKASSESASNHANEYTFAAASPEGERLEWSGVFLLEPLSSHGTFAVTDLHAGTIWSYLQAPLPLEIPSGTIAVKGEYTFDNAGKAPAVKVDVHDTTVSDLHLRPRQGTIDYVVLGKLNVHETRVDLARRAVEIEKVSLSGGEVNAWIGPQGQVNLLELTKAPGSAAARADDAPSGAGGAAPAWTISVPDISVNGFKVSAEDRQVTPALALVLDPIDIHVAGYNTTPAARLDITAKTTINSSGTLSATAQLSPSGAGDVTAHIDLAKLDLTMFQPFIAQRTAMTLQSGQLATQLDVKKAADGTLAVKGDVDVAGLRSVDELQESFIKWKDLRLAGLQYSSQPASLRIDTVTAQGPYARVIIAPDRTVNVQQVLAGPNKGTPSLATQLGAANAKAGGVAVAGIKGGPPGQPDAKSIAANAQADADKAAAAAKAGADKAAADAANKATADAKAAASDANAKVADAGAAAAGAPTSGAASSAAGTTKGAKRSHKRHGTGASGGAGDETSGGTAAAQAGGAQAPPSMPMSIGIVRVIDGSANYADFWIKPNFAVGIQALNGTVEGLSSDPKSRATVRLEGKVDRYAPVSINGKLNLLAATVYTDIKMSFKGLELTTVTPYSAHFAGYKIDKGKLSVDLSYKVEQRKLTAEQHFVIDQLQLGEQVDSPDAVHLPLKLAVALLKDRNGVIDLPLPITGSLDDPQFKVGPIIWHAIVNLLEKAVTAPFAAIGRLFGGHGEEMKFIDFDPGSANLDAASKEKLDSLGKALQEHTQLQLDVPIVFSQDLDTPVLAKRKLDQRLIARAYSGKTSKKQAEASGTRQAGAATPAGGAQQGGGTAGSAAGQQPAPPPDPALADPLQHYRLLLAEFQADLGKDADLPASVAAIQNAKSKKDAPPVETAIPDLEAALIPQMEVTDVDLQGLGKNRTRAIQNVLLTDGGIDASRVFIINGNAKTDDNGKVRVEMALK